MSVYPGNLLTVTAASVNAVPASTRTWAWLRNNTAIPAQTSTTYRITEADIGTVLAAQQTETNFVGATSVSSAQIGPIQAFSPSLLFAAGEPGVWFDPSDVANLDWRRNLLTYTEQFDNSVWLMLGSSGASRTANVTTAPDGTNTADKYAVGTGSGAWYIANYANPNLVSGQAYTFSVYVKADGLNFVFVRPHNNTGTFGASGFIVSLTDGTITYPSNPLTPASTGVATSVGNGWWRISATSTANASSTGGAGGPGIWPCNGTTFSSTNGSGPANFTGDGTSGLFLWGAQLELGSVATDYQRITDVNTEVVERFPNATLYQDAAGTQPVTGPTNLAGNTSAVGLMLDKRLQQSWIDSSGNVWTKTAGDGVVSVSGNTITITGATTATQVTRSGGNLPFAQGIARMIITATWSSATGVQAWLRGVPNALTNGVQATISSNLNNSSLERLDVSTGSVTFTITSFQYWAGNHAVQATTANRPIYGIHPFGGRRNLLVRTEEFENASWVKTNATITANSAVAPDGTTTADTFTATSASHTVYQSLTATATIYTASVYFKQGTDTAFEIQFNTASFALGVRLRYTFSTAATTVTLGGSPSNVSTNVVDVGSGWFRATISVLCTAATWFFDVHGITSGATSLVWGAQLETGSTATAYQRVTDQYNVTEAGVPSVSYLFFNGNNFSMATSTITPGVDKAQVFAGVRKLSDAAVGVVAELSAAAGTNRGAFVLLSPGSTGASGNFAFYSTGSLVVGSNATSATTLAPVSAVLTAIGDISGDLSSIRTNGVVGTNVTTDQGTGNYLAYPLYIGHRFNNPPTTPSSLFFSGHLYSLIVRFGPNLTSTFISATEAWVAGKTGIVIA
jgi:hypothetical protein